MLSKVCGETYPKTEPILWLNMRQEPSLYVNGEPVCARPPNKVRTKHLMFLDGLDLSASVQQDEAF